MLADLEDEDEEDHGRDIPAAFPRLGDRAATLKATASDEVLLRVQQRAAVDDQPNSFEVLTSPKDGCTEIPLVVSATTVGSRVPREVLLRSPWLARCLVSTQGATAVRPLTGEGELQWDAGSSSEGPSTGATAAAASAGAAEAQVICRRAGGGTILELGLPARGPGHLLLSARGLLECLDLCGFAGSQRLVEALAAAPAPRLLALLLWATVLELPVLTEACHAALPAALDAANLALALACGHAACDPDLLRLCYWRLRELLCGAGGVPPAWLDGRGPVFLVRGTLAHRGAGRTPLSVLQAVLEEDVAAKTRRWLVPADGYTLCRVHRQRPAGGGYPHLYELRLDHSDELLLTASREDEQSACRLFEHAAAAEPGASEHSEAFLGVVLPNFWGTSFELHDSGTDVGALARRAPAAAGLPVHQRRCLCRVGYETNLLGDSPRKITVDFERDGVHHHMENIAPRWDKKLNSYALPFFGRVKKASAKNFQLVVDGDSNTIFLMFGKISKDVFCLDFRSPLALLDAMAIATAALAKKRAVS